MVLQTVMQTRVASNHGGRVIQTIRLSGRFEKREAVMRWNERTLRRVEALIVGIVIAIVAVAYVVSRLR